MKKPGLCGFQFCWCIQHPGPAVPVDSTKLVCIDDYRPGQEKPLRRDKEDVELESHEVTALHYWFDEHEENEVQCHDSLNNIACSLMLCSFCKVTDDPMPVQTSGSESEQ